MHSSTILHFDINWILPEIKNQYTTHEHKKILSTNKCLIAFMHCQDHSMLTDIAKFAYIFLCTTLKFACMQFTLLICLYFYIYVEWGALNEFKMMKQSHEVLHQYELPLAVEDAFA